MSPWSCIFQSPSCYVQQDVGDGVGLALERILFVLPKIRSKLEHFLMRHLENFASGSKRSKTPYCMDGAGMSTVCLFKKIDEQYALAGKHTKIKRKH